MTQSQPPAGWYPDPQDATQQRYWDGAAWTGHTAAAGTSAAAPEGAATSGAPIPAAGAPAWTMQPTGDVTGGKKSWFKRPLIIIPVAIVLALIVVGVVVALVNGTDHSKELADRIKSDGQSQLQSAFSQQLPGSTVKVTDVKCVEKSNTQEYTCLIHMNVTYQGQTKSFIQNADGSCDKKVNAHCLWHTTDNPQLTASQ
ncbi:MAG TPA: DUF2510 domain-containing protein [Mycobacteriales bacterium]|nr:DUF2510 domain-containing protein [Mycobacteriales bacterium]